MAGGLIVLLLLGSIVGFVNYRAQKSYLSRVQQQLNVADQELTVANGMMHGLTPVTPQQDLDTVSAHFEKADAALKSAHDLLAADNVVVWAQRTPRLGAQVDAVYAFIQIGQDAVAAGKDAVDVVTQLNQMSVSQPGLSPSERIYALAQKAQPELTAAAAAVAQAQKTRKAIKVNELIPQLASKLPSIDHSLASAGSLITQFQQGLTIILPALGATTPQHYLLIFADTAELRGAGGLYGSAGTITYDKGKQSPLAIQDIYTIQAPTTDGLPKAGGGYTFVPQPAPMAEVLPGWSFNLINAGWSPDFPTAAQQSEQFYNADTKSTVNGVIAVDEVAAQELIEATGPISVPSYNVTITSANLVQETVKLIELNPTPGQERKTFLSVLAQAEFQKLVTLPPAQWPLAVKQVQKAIAGRHLQIYMNDAPAQAFISQLGADGSLVTTQNDFVSVVDNQLGQTKVAIYVDRKFSDKVTVNSDGSTQHQLTLTYHNNGSVTDTATFGGTFKNYLRVFVPPGAKLVKETGFTSEFQQGTESGAAVFQGWAAVNAQTSLTVNLTYTVPVQKGTKSNEYQLFWRKEAGVDPYPVQVQVVSAAGQALTPASSSTPASSATASIDSDKTFAWKR